MTRFLVSIVAFSLSAAATARDIPCPDMPPTANRAKQTDRSLDIRAFGLGVGGGRLNVEQVTDIYGSDNNWDREDAMLIAQNCQVVRNQWPGNLTQQFNAHLKFVEKLRLDRKMRAGSTASIHIASIAETESQWVNVRLRFLDEAAAHNRITSAMQVVARSEISCRVDNNFWLTACATYKRNQASEKLLKEALAYASNAYVMAYDRRPEIIGKYVWIPMSHYSLTDKPEKME